jgi:hypothetical protein
MTFLDIAAAELKDIDMADSFFSDDEDFAMAATVQPDNNDYLQQEQEEYDICTCSILSICLGTDSYISSVFLYRMFYKSLFPWKTYFNWLNYDTSKPKREHLL